MIEEDKHRLTAGLLHGDQVNNEDAGNPYPDKTGLPKCKFAKPHNHSVLTEAS